MHAYVELRYVLEALEQAWIPWILGLHACSKACRAPRSTECPASLPAGAPRTQRVHIHICITLIMRMTIDVEIYMYIYIYTCTSVCVCVYIYILVFIHCPLKDSGFKFQLYFRYLILWLYSEYGTRILVITEARGG